MILIFWTVAGALIGVWAAKVKGFHPGAGIFGGAVLGAFAPLLFFVSTDPAIAKTCRFCKEKIKADATVCRYCQKDLPAPRPVLPVRKSA